jgi:pimeloyl-ACP methyl ester carboxylesterase
MWDYLPISELNTTNIFIDLPGHGDSSLEDRQEPSIEFMADEVEKILIQQDVEKFHIVGHSMGGYVALMLKAKMSNCDKVILLNSNYWADSKTKQKDRDRVSKIAYKAKDYFLLEAIPNLFSDRKKYKKEINKLIEEAKEISSEEIAYASLAMKNRNDFTALLNDKEYIILHGTLDNFVQIGQFDLELIGRSHFHEIPEAGHMSHIENSSEVMDTLKKYLN